MQIHSNLPILVNQNPMPQRNALPMIKEMVKLQWIAEHVGISPVCMTYAMRGTSPNGRPFHLSAQRVEQVNAILLNLAHHLLRTTITRDDISEHTGRLAWGGTPLIQLKHLDQAINIRYLFLKEMCWTLPQYENRLRKRTLPSYGRFTDEHLRAINSALPRMAMTLMQISIQAPAESVQE